MALKIQIYILFAQTKSVFCVYNSKHLPHQKRAVFLRLKTLLFMHNQV